MDGYLTSAACCAGWRFVVEELTAAGARAQLADPAETAGLRGPKRRAKTDRADARLLRTLLWEGRLPESAIPPAHVLEVHTLGRLYCALMDERRAWQARAVELFEQGRAVMFSQILDARSDLTDLQRDHPQLAERFVRCRDVLDRPDTHPSGPAGMDSATAARLDTDARRRRPPNSNRSCPKSTHCPASSGS